MMGFGKTRRLKGSGVVWFLESWKGKEVSRNVTSIEMKSLLF